MREKSCENCMYFVKPDPEPGESLAECEAVYEVGDCHRFPANVIPEDYGFTHVNVFRDDWCGEFEPNQ